MKPIYISSAYSVTGQGEENDQAITTPTDFRYKTFQPDFTRYMAPLESRRFSNIKKLGMYCGLLCLENAGVTKPDAIITGTAKGSTSDIEKFLRQVKEYDEEVMNPTPFIVATYNNINGGIALKTDAKGYNQTYVHAGSALESALLDTQLFLNEHNELDQNVLVGVFEHTGDSHFKLLKKAGYVKENLDPNRPLLEQHDSNGTVMGEGVSFFVATNAIDEGAFAIIDIHTWQREAPKEKINSLLQKNYLEKSEIDLLILGLNGNKKDQNAYETALEYFANDVPVLCFKHLSGEFQTSLGYGLTLLFRHLRDLPIPQQAWWRQPKETKPKNILVYNHFDNVDHNLLLLRSC